jgi:hypothetical protein
MEENNDFVAKQVLSLSVYSVTHRDGSCSSLMLATILTTTPYHP